ncbi:MAG TPA: hypothetical protein DEB56_03360 [Thiobacillus sp.]|nr:hypothetical protein [Thiobacillus sp.]
MTDASWWVRFVANLVVAGAEYLVNRHDARVVTIHGKRVVIRDRAGAVLAEPREDHTDPGSPPAPTPA